MGDYIGPSRVNPGSKMCLYLRIKEGVAQNLKYLHSYLHIILILPHVVIKNHLSSSSNFDSIDKNRRPDFSNYRQNQYYQKILKFSSENVPPPWKIEFCMNVPCNIFFSFFRHFNF